MLTTIQLGWLIVTFISLSFAAYFDWRSRIIPDKIWLFQLMGGMILLISWFVQSQSLFEITLVISNVIFGFLISLVIIFTGAMSGGDIKGIFATSISFPVLVTISSPLGDLPEYFPSLFSLLLNFFFYYIILALGFFSINFVRLARGPATFSGIEGSLSQQLKIMFEGIYVSTENIEKLDFYNPAEVFEENAWRLYTPRFDGMMTDEEFEEIEREERHAMLDAIKATGKKHIWIRPQIPGLVIWYLSFLTTIFLGTILGPLFGIFTSTV